MSSISVSVNGECQVPPGFRFQPTEEELLQYYLRKRVSSQKIDLDLICDINLNKFEPWDIQEKCKIGTIPQNDWYFFSRKDKKYPSGMRTNRATIAGFWKATGRDKVIYSNGRRIGLRKTLVFYNGRAPRGERSEWIMHEYRFLIDLVDTKNVTTNAAGEVPTEEDGWVVCHLFMKKKKNNKTLNSPSDSSPGELGHQMSDSGYDEGGALEQIFQQAQRTCTQYDENIKAIDSEQPSHCKLGEMVKDNIAPDQNSLHHQIVSGLTSWAVFDRLVASQLNGCTACCSD